MFVENNLPFPELEGVELLNDEERLQEAVPQRRGNALASQGHRIQNQLIRNHFSKLGD